MRTTLSVLVGALLVAGCDKSPTPSGQAQAATAPAAVPVAAVQADAGKGEHVYKGTCAMCHGTGAGGSPLFKSKEDWAPRIAQGKDVLYGHALKGFTGAKGTMPAKGGNAALSDDDVKAGVDYMVSKAS